MKIVPAPAHPATALRRLLLSALLAAAAASPSAAAPGRGVDVYFRGTDREVVVHTARGPEPGPTLLIVGGIHGDESAGYLTAERFTGLRLQRGSLIVVSRLNRPAIVAHRRAGPGGDMNRMFDLPENASAPDVPVVNLARTLVRQSDYVLNLHQGVGFYSPVWVNPQRNPLRWGQCNVIDAPSFDLPNGKKIELEQFARRIVLRLNGRIPEKAFRFLVNNTNTMSEDSQHKEQRKSLTYYALTRAHKISLGLEATLNCTPEQAVAFLTLAIEAVMAEAGITAADLPSGRLPDIRRELAAGARFAAVGVSVNDRPRRVPAGGALLVRAGDTVRVLEVEAASLGWRAALAPGKSPGAADAGGRIRADARILVRRDGKLAGELPVRVCARLVDSLLVQVGGASRSVANGETLAVARGDAIKLLAVSPAAPDLRVNFRGFVPPGGRAGTNDLGHAISFADLQRRFACDDAGTLYAIEVSGGNGRVGEFYISFSPPPAPDAAGAPS